MVMKRGPVCMKEVWLALAQAAFWVVQSSFPISFHIPLGLLGTRKLHTVNDCSHSNRQVAAMAEA